MKLCTKRRPSLVERRNWTHLGKMGMRSTLKTLPRQQGGEGSETEKGWCHGMCLELVAINQDSKVEVLGEAVGGEGEIYIRDCNKKECFLMDNRNLRIKTCQNKKKEYMQ